MDYSNKRQDDHIGRLVIMEPHPFESPLLFGIYYIYKCIMYILKIFYLLLVFWFCQVLLVKSRSAY